ncbi:hypothetical protein ACOSQ4_032153 [Xanthoceras sorbifolium]
MCHTILNTRDSLTLNNSNLFKTSSNITNDRCSNTRFSRRNLHTHGHISSICFNPSDLQLMVFGQHQPLPQHQKLSNLSAEKKPEKRREETATVMNNIPDPNSTQSQEELTSAILHLMANW